MPCANLCHRSDPRATALQLDQTDWVFELKSRVKRNRRLATAIFYLTDLAYLNLGERTRFLSSFPAGSTLLNLGSGFRSSPPGFLSVDREAYPGVAIRGDLTSMPVLDESVDGILCEMVLEHVPDSEGALREFRRILRPGGRVYLAVPFLWPYHASPHDYRRWTTSGFERDLTGFEAISAGLSGGPTTTLVNVLHEWLSMALSFNIDAIYRLLYLALMPILFPFKLLDVVLSRYRHASKIGSLLYFHGRKPAGVSPGTAASTSVGNPAVRPTR
jgi:SAM-dependent methyltransferase